MTREARLAALRIQLIARGKSEEQADLDIEATRRTLAFGDVFGAALGRIADAIERANPNG